MWMLVCPSQQAYHCSAQIGRFIHGCGTRSANDCGSIRATLVGPGLLGFALLVLIHGVRRAESVSVGVHQVVPDDADSAEVWDEISVVAKSKRLGQPQLEMTSQRETEKGGSTRLLGMSAVSIGQNSGSCVG